MIIKKSFLFTTFVCLSLVFSCASTKVSTSTDQENSEKQLKISTEDQDFINSLSNYQLSLIQIPKAADYGKKFSSSFILSVKKTDGSIAKDFPITIEYPIGLKNQDVLFEKINLTTNEKGRIIFNPEKTDFSVNSTIYFYPTCSSKNKKTIQAVKEIGISTNYTIKSRLLSDGAILFIYEFNEKDKPSTNNFTVLSALQAKGVTAGNAPISSEDLIGASNQQIFSKNKVYVEDHFGYLICGTIKHVNPVKQNEDKSWTCSLIAEIYVLDMSDGKEIYRKTFTYELKDAKYDKAISNAKKEIGKIITEDLTKSL